MVLGSPLVSTMATIGIWSLLASRTALASLQTSMTTSAAGSFFMPAMPSRSRWSFRARRLRLATSFFFIEATVSEFSVASISAILAMLLQIVALLVSVPPSQRSETLNMLVSAASSLTRSRIWRLVPTKRISPPSMTTFCRKLQASAICRMVLVRSMMVIPFLAP